MENGGFWKRVAKNSVGKRWKFVVLFFFDSKSSGRKRDGCYGFCSVWKQDVSNPELIILIIAKKSCVP